MKVSTAQSSASTWPEEKKSAWPLIIAISCFGLLWLETINHLKGEWSFNPQYAYGWGVPFLALYLFWRRWSTRPAPAPPGQRRWPIALVIFCALIFSPIRFLSEANPDWRLLSWAFSVVAVLITTSCIFLAGGRRWLHHFAFPIVFFLVAVPWPTHLEQFVVQHLMSAEAAINVSMLNLAGIPAVQQGNVIEVGSALIGIEEACSGVRSLQATLMVSLFLGELYSFNALARAILVASGALLAFFCNLVRTAILVWIGAHQGTEAIEKWHDPAGMTILLVCLAGLWMLSLTMQRRSILVSEQSPSSGTMIPVRFSQPLLIGLTLWILVAEASVQSWYRFHQPSVADTRWAVNWPTSETEYKSVRVPTEAEDLLRYNEGGAGTWQGNDGRPWMMYFFRWFPGRTAALFVKIHRPDVCLPASGMTLSHDAGLRVITVNGASLPIRSYRFYDRGTPLHVFYCYSDGRSSYENAAAAEREDWTARGRLRTAWQGRRDVGAQMLEIVVWGYEDDRDAEEALQRQLAKIIQLG
jgi:exosortase